MFVSADDRCTWMQVMPKWPWQNLQGDLFIHSFIHLQILKKNVAILKKCRNTYSKIRYRLLAYTNKNWNTSQFTCALIWKPPETDDPLLDRNCQLFNISGAEWMIDDHLNWRWDKFSIFKISGRGCRLILKGSWETDSHQVFVVRTRSAENIHAKWHFYFML